MCGGSYDNVAVSSRMGILCSVACACNADIRSLYIQVICGRNCYAIVRTKCYPAVGEQGCIN
jgi:hypothetical protein